VIPFVTEEIWSYLPGPDDLLMGHRWPEADGSLRDAEAEVEVQRAIEATQTLRAWREGVRAKAAAIVPARLDAPGYDRVADHVARLARFEFSADGDGVGGDDVVSTVVVPGGSVLVLPSDAVDMEAEKQRAAERAEQCRQQISRIEGKLANEKFVAKAPEAVVQAERDKLETLKKELEELS
jgi:valyl-tRNA synthetase